MLRVSEIRICLKVHLFFFTFFAILEEPRWWARSGGSVQWRRPVYRSLAQV